jgi:hypothetical protein
VLHRDDQVTRAEHHLLSMISDLIKVAAKAGTVRDDVSPTELANYCVRALTASRTLPSRAAIRRLVEVTLDGLRPKR